MDLSRQLHSSSLFTQSLPTLPSIKSWYFKVLCDNFVGGEVRILHNVTLEQWTIFCWQTRAALKCVGFACAIMVEISVDILQITTYSGVHSVSKLWYNKWAYITKVTSRYLCLATWKTGNYPSDILLYLVCYVRSQTYTIDVLHAKWCAVEAAAHLAVSAELGLILPTCSWLTIWLWLPWIYRKGKPSACK